MSTNICCVYFVIDFISPSDKDNFIKGHTEKLSPVTKCKIGHMTGLDPSKRYKTVYPFYHVALTIRCSSKLKADRVEKQIQNYFKDSRIDRERTTSELFYLDSKLLKFIEQAKLKKLENLANSDNILDAALSDIIHAHEFRDLIIDGKPFPGYKISATGQVYGKSGKAKILGKRNAIQLEYPKPSNKQKKTLTIQQVKKAQKESWK